MVRSSGWGRRSFLKGAGVLSVGLAGCLGQNDDQNPNGTAENGTVTGTAAPSPNGTPNGTPDATETPAGTEAGSEEDLSWARNRGTLIDTFAKFDENWEVQDGNASVTNRTAFSGNESVLMDSSDSNRVRVARSFESSMDFRNRDLSIAVKPVESSNRFISLSIQLVGLFGGTRTLSRYVNTSPENRWVRLDLGLDGEENVNMRAIKGIRIYCWDGDAASKFYIDDLRIMEKPEKGVVTFNFEGGSPKDYNVAYQALKKRGWTGTLFTPSDDIDQGEAPSVAQYREMRENGWIIGGNTVGHQRLTDFSAGDQEIIFAENRRQLEQKGLLGDFVPFLPPYSSYNAETFELVLEYFDGMYVPAGRPSGVPVPVTDPRTIGTINGEDLEEARGAVDDAANYKQMAAFTIRMDEVQGGHVDKLCNYVQQAVNAGNVEVLNTAEHFQRYATRPEN